MKKSAIWCVAWVVCSAAFARPPLIRESAVIEMPEESYGLVGEAIAIDGDWAIITAIDDEDLLGLPYDLVALLYHRVGGQWTFDRVLVRRHYTDEHFPPHVAMNNGLAAISSNVIDVFRRDGNSWNAVAHPFNDPPRSPNGLNGSGLALRDGTLAFGVGPCSSVPSSSDWGILVSPRRSDGTWATPQRLGSDDYVCEGIPRSLDMTQDTLAIASGPINLSDEGHRVRVFRRSGTAWYSAFALADGGPRVAVRGAEILVAGAPREGTRVYRNDGTLQIIDRLRTVSTLQGGSANAFAHTDQLFVQTSGEPRLAQRVFTKNSAGRYQHVATLSDWRGGNRWSIAMSGRRVLVQGFRDITENPGVVFVFDVPESLSGIPVRQYTFEGGSASGWTATSGSFAVARVGANRVYRQSSLAGDARAVLGGPTLTDQAVEADITPTAFSGADRWVGLAVRYTSPSNFYYVTLRNTGLIELRRMQDGLITILDSFRLAVVAGQPYRVQLAAFGTDIVAYLDGRQVLNHEEVSIRREATLARGRVALVGYRAQADFDNVVVQTTGRSTMIDEGDAGCPQQAGSAWITAGVGTWECETSEIVPMILRHTQTSGDSSAVVGVPTDDQVVRVRARATGFGAGADRWFGIAARHRDAGNYYYLSLRNSNQVSLRKQVNGSISVLASAPLAVASGTWYELRLEAIGNQVRGYVNGALAVQATDNTHATGVTGIVKYRAAAEYQDFLAYQP